MAYANMSNYFNLTALDIFVDWLQGAPKKANKNTAELTGLDYILRGGTYKSVSSKYAFDTGIIADNADIFYLNDKWATGEIPTGHPQADLLDATGSGKFPQLPFRLFRAIESSTAGVAEKDGSGNWQYDFVGDVIDIDPSDVPAADYATLQSIIATHVVDADLIGNTNVLGAVDGSGYGLARHLTSLTELQIVNLDELYEELSTTANDAADGFMVGSPTSTLDILIAGAGTRLKALLDIDVALT